MPCFRPLKGYRGTTPNPESGKYPIVFKLGEAKLNSGKPETVNLPCGQCIGCRLERSRQWAIRCVHEASLYQDNSFITLTYNPENLPKDHSLNKAHFQKFMKKLRKANEPKKIRFFHCGEYGEKSMRPHYHACLFNHDFKDKYHWTTQNGNKLYRSAKLEEHWPLGFALIGDVTFESAAYVARYITKKITGNKSEKHYKYTDPSGTVYSIIPEYTTMSNRPGIARAWFETWHQDIYPNDKIVLRGREMKPPSYYDRCFEIKDLKTFDKVKRARHNKAVITEQKNPESRLSTMEYCQEKKAKTLIRSIE